MQSFHILLFCFVHRWIKGSYTVERHQPSYTLMCHSKALWDTSSSSRKHSKCPKHSSTRCTCSTATTNIPKTRPAALPTSGICWLGSAVDRGGALRRCAVAVWEAERPGIRKPGSTPASGAGMLEAWETRFSDFTPKVKLLLPSAPVRESLGWGAQSEAPAARRRRAGPSSPACVTSDRNEWIIEAVEGKRRFPPNTEFTSQCVFCTCCLTPPLQSTPKCVTANQGRSYRWHP